MITVKLLHPPLGSSWVVAADGLTVFVNLVLVIEVSGVVYSVVVRISWVTCPYFEGPVFFLFVLDVPILLVVDISLGVLSVVTSLGDSVLRRVVPFLGSGVDDGRIGCDIANVYHLNFLVGTIFDKVTLLSTL